MKKNNNTKKNNIFIKGHEVHKSKSMKKYYVYVYLDPLKPGKFIYGNFCFNFEPFYVGKGSGARAISHLKETSENTDNKFKFRKINKILNSGKVPIITKVQESMEEVSAFLLEKKLIKLIGRKTFKEGVLTNISIGGESPPKFYDLPIEQQEEIRQKFRDKKYSQETINKRIKKNTGKKRTEEFRKNLSESRKGMGNPMYGKKFTKKHRAKISESMINNSNSKKVGQYDIYNNFIKEWKSCHEIERELGFKFSCIARVCRGERKSSYSFIWKYLN